MTKHPGRSTAQTDRPAFGIEITKEMVLAGASRAADLKDFAPAYVAEEIFAAMAAASLQVSIVDRAARARNQSRQWDRSYSDLVVRSMHEVPLGRVDWPDLMRSLLAEICFFVSI